MIPLVEKTWFDWWIVAIVFTTRWFHVLARYNKVGDFDAFTSEEKAQKCRCARPENASCLFDGDKAHFRKAQADLRNRTRLALREVDRGREK